MSAHTPAPWTVEVNDEGDMAFVRTSHGEMISACDLPDVLYLSIHNARLIAAAPDLLAALKAIREGVEDDPVGADHGECFSYEREGSDNCDIETVDQRCALCRAADAAIAKAEGGH